MPGQALHRSDNRLRAPTQVHHIQAIWPVASDFERATRQLKHIRVEGQAYSEQRGLNSPAKSLLPAPLSGKTRAAVSYSIGAIRWKAPHGLVAAEGDVFRSQYTLFPPSAQFQQGIIPLEHPG